MFRSDSLGKEKLPKALEIEKNYMPLRGNVFAYSGLKIFVRHRVGASPSQTDRPGKEANKLWWTGKAEG